ncbi:hypothetical protein V6N11_000101 [Hibiscus sabdariffa]|uniref:F-box associated beta-propeller type 1 domain-containing protein n=1 Tax=Hibiscus sabdariffa TaxID=183260 RepID=A0ABR2NNN6_9ROSI
MVNLGPEQLAPVLLDRVTIRTWPRESSLKTLAATHRSRRRRCSLRRSPRFIADSKSRQYPYVAPVVSILLVGLIFARKLLEVVVSGLKVLGSAIAAAVPVAMSCQCHKNATVQDKDQALAWTRIRSLFGFGYDPINDDYKVIRIYQNFAATREHRALSYSLRSKSWKKIPGFCNWVCMPPCSGVYANGAMHWLAHKSILKFVNKGDKFIVAIM